MIANMINHNIILSVFSTQNFYFPQDVPISPCPLHIKICWVMYDLIKKRRALESPPFACNEDVCPYSLIDINSTSKRRTAFGPIGPVPLSP